MRPSERIDRAPVTEDDRCDGYASRMRCNLRRFHLCQHEATNHLDCFRWPQTKIELEAAKAHHETRKAPTP